MHITITPEFIASVAALITAAIAHYRLSASAEKIVSDAKIAAAKVVADAIMAAAQVKADAKAGQP